MLSFQILSFQIYFISSRSTAIGPPLAAGYLSSQVVKLAPKLLWHLCYQRQTSPLYLWGHSIQRYWKSTNGACPLLEKV